MNNPAPRSRWRVYLLLGRVSNLPTVWTNCLAGVSLAGHDVDRSLAWLFVATSLMYVAGMYLNDAFDQTFDRQYRPERPIPSGQITAWKVYLLGFGMMAAGFAVVAVETGFRPEPVGWSALLAILIIYYNYRHKKDPLSPLIMALCRVMVYFIAAASVGSAVTSEVLLGATVLAGYLIGLTYVAKQENLNEIKNLWPLAFLSLPLIYFFRGANLIACLALVGWTIYALSFLTGPERRIPIAVVGLIAGISLLDAVIISTIPDHSPLAIAAATGFVLTLAFQRFVPGT